MTRPRYRPPAYDLAEAVLHLRRCDSRVDSLIAKVGPCTLTIHNLPPFEALLQSIVYQQLNGRAAETILGRVLALYKPQRFPRPEDLLATDDSILRSAGLSRAKTAAVKSLARHALEGAIPTRPQALRLPNQAVIDVLTRVRGIGVWTVEMFLIFGLGRPDVWPVLDFGVRKGLALTMGKRRVPTPKQVLSFARKFSPYGSVAAWYFWRACELKPEDLRPKAKAARIQSR